MASKKRRLKKSRKHLPLRNNITLAEYHRRTRAADSVSIGHPLVVDFGNEALREAFRVWWHPYDMGDDFNRLVGASVYSAIKGLHGLKLVKPRTVRDGGTIERRKLDPNPRLLAAFKKVGAHRTDSPAKAPVKVRIVLTYPLSEIRTKVVTIDRRYPGEVFAFAHDFYRELYAEDEKRGGKQGPMNNGKGPLLNRGKGPLIWGHDIGDLVFESTHYIELPKKGGLSGKTDKRCVEAWGEGLELAPRRLDGAEGCFLFSIGS